MVLHYFVKDDVKSPWGEFDVSLRIENIAAPISVPNQSQSLKKRLAGVLPLLLELKGKPQGSCPACTYLNLPGSRTCAMCLKPLLIDFGLQGISI